MIINVNIENPDSEFQPLPHYDLPNHEVALTQLFIEFSEPVHNQFFVLSSTLVDKNDTNRKQELFSFFVGKTTKYVCYTPTRLSWYKMQISSTDHSVFKLSGLTSEKIKKIKIQLEINARNKCVSTEPLY